jgi:hypothetical protein
MDFVSVALVVQGSIDSLENLPKNLVASVLPVSQCVCVVLDLPSVQEIKAAAGLLVHRIDPTE